MEINRYDYGQKRRILSRTLTVLSSGKGHTLDIPQIMAFLNGRECAPSAQAVFDRRWSAERLGLSVSIGDAILE